MKAGIELVNAKKRALLQCIQNWTRQREQSLGAVRLTLQRQTHGTVVTLVNELRFPPRRLIGAAILVDIDNSKICPSHELNQGRTMGAPQYIDRTGELAVT